MAAQERVANPRRGDIEITLAEKKYVLRPNFDAVAKIEAVTGKTLVRLVNDYRLPGASAVSMAEMTAILHIAISALEGQKPPKQLGQVVMKAGMLNLLPRVTLYLAETLLGEQDEDDAAPGEAPAPATSQEA